MTKDISSPPILDINSAVKGFISGGFMGLGVFSGWDIVSGVILFGAGFLIFLDSLMPSDRMMYVVTSVFSMIIGILLSFFAAVSAIHLPLFVVLLLLAAVTYIDKLKRMRSMVRR